MHLRDQSFSPIFLYASGRAIRKFAFAGLAVLSEEVLGLFSRAVYNGFGKVLMTPERKIRHMVRSGGAVGPSAPSIRRWPI